MMNMIKKYLINKISVTTMCILLLTMFYLIPTANIQPQIDKENLNAKEKVVYLLDNDSYISKVKYFFDDKTLEEEIKNRLEILKNGLETIDIFYPLIPVNTKINSIKVEKNSVYIDFSKEILNVDEYLEESMIEAIVYTLSEINGIEKIYMKVEGKELKQLPNSRKNIPYPLTRSIGINKNYNLENLKDIEKTTVVFSKKQENIHYYVPITMINNNSDDKIKIIIEELKSSIHSQNELNGLINDKLILEDYSIENKTMSLVFNEYIFENLEQNLISEEVKNVISESIFENYDINEIVLNTKDQKNIIKIKETP